MEEVSKLILLLFNSLICLGISRATEFEFGQDDKPTSKQLLWFIRYYGELWFGEWVMKPICGCIVCMGSIHGAWYYYLNFGLDYWMIAWCFALSGVNYIVYKLFLSCE